VRSGCVSWERVGFADIWLTDTLLLRSMCGCLLLLLLWYCLFFFFLFACPGAAP